MEKKDVYNLIMSEFRCCNCNKLIFKGKIHGEYHIEAFCTRCKKITIFEKQVVEKNNNLC